MPVSTTGGVRSPPMDTTSPLLTDPDPTTQNLIALSQDVTALLSLSIEASASLVHDVYRSVLGKIGLTSSTLGVVPPSLRGNNTLQSGQAVVVVGASEDVGQTLTLQLAKAGYTVFPLLPLPSPSSPPTSVALSSLLLSWSRMQKRLKAKNPAHKGTVVPVMMDPEGYTSPHVPHWSNETQPKGKGRYAHAGETIRAYCRKNGLALTAIVCSPRTVKKIDQSPAWEISPPQAYNAEFDEPSMDTSQPQSPQPQQSKSYDSNASNPSSQYENPEKPTQLIIPRPLSGRLIDTNEQTLLSMYSCTVIEPLAVVRELSDQLGDLSTATQQGRVVFVSTSPSLPESSITRASSIGASEEGVSTIINAARQQAIKLLRDDLKDVGIQVCEVVVGPMQNRIKHTAYHLRHSSDDSTSSGRSGDGQDAPRHLNNDQIHESREQILAKRLALLSRVWAVDDALLFSAVRRAIEDKHPRFRHNAGISPFLDKICEVTPGSGIVKMLGRWLVGRLLTPRSPT